MNASAKVASIFLPLGLIACSSLGSSQIGLLNGGFEVPVLGSAGGFFPYDAPPANFGWTIAPNTGIDILGSGYWQPSGGQQSLDLSGFGPGSIYQDFSFSSAGAWSVGFDMSVNPAAGGNRSMEILFGLANGPLSSVGTFTLSSAGRTAANMNWLHESTGAFIADATSTYRLQFVALDGDASGVALDNISLVQVPEPGTGAMILAGLAIVLGQFGSSRKD